MTDDRTARMIEMREQGASLQRIGDEFGLTRQRVHQLLAPYDELKRPSVSTTKIRRVFDGIGSLAAAAERNKHGTLNRYYGNHRAFPACRCAECTRANRDHCYRYREGRTS